MTEQELLQASEDDYMNAEQFAFFKARLLALRETFVERMNNHRHGENERHADEADKATADETYWLNVQLREREARQINDIDTALKRIRSGDYGWCEDTGEMIGLRRLLANPMAQYCAHAMERRERRARTIGTLGSVRDDDIMTTA